MSASILLSAPVLRTRLNLRAEARRALFAAAQVCWLFPVVLILATLGHFASAVSPVALWLMYWLGLDVGRYLPQLFAHRQVSISRRLRTERQILASRRHWQALQLATVAIAILMLFLIARFDLYRDSPLLDLTWLSTYLTKLFRLSEGFTTEQVSTAALLYVYIRGLGLAQRPLTLWFIGYQFRLGIVGFFLLTLATAFIHGADFRIWILVYFIVSLLGIALARMEESGREMALGGRWAGVLIGATVGAVTIGFVVTRVFTIETADAIFRLFSPLLFLLILIISIIVIPLIYLMQGVVSLLAPLLHSVADLLARLHLPLPSLPDQPAQNFEQMINQFSGLFLLLRLLTIILIVFGIALLIARALNRQIQQAEEEAFVRERLEVRSTRAAEKIASPRARRVSGREIEAENIRRIYAALLARAAALGLPRREAETPFEFLPRLSARWPEAAVDMRALTEAYVAVHYAQAVATPSQVQAMRGVWQRLKRQLQSPGDGRSKTKTKALPSTLA